MNIFATILNLILVCVGIGTVIDGLMIANLLEAAIGAIILLISAINLVAIYE